MFDLKFQRSNIEVFDPENDIFFVWFDYDNEYTLYFSSSADKWQLVDFIDMKKIGRRLTLDGIVMDTYFIDYLGKRYYKTSTGLYLWCESQVPNRWIISDNLGIFDELRDVWWSSKTKTGTYLYLGEDVAFEEKRVEVAEIFNGWEKSTENGMVGIYEGVGDKEGTTRTVGFPIVVASQDSKYEFGGANYKFNVVGYKNNNLYWKYNDGEQIWYIHARIVGGEKYWVITTDFYGNSFSVKQGGFIGEWDEVNDKPLPDPEGVRYYTFYRKDFDDGEFVGEYKKIYWTDETESSEVESHEYGSTDISIDSFEIGSIFENSLVFNGGRYL